ncbi:glycosyltransferase family 2 protein [Pelagibacterium montanilacus]|uniref:glycosyltransferase family 2 protein n=1 Tax=Pelagibacterium montanilacus TaxID=2185280 RepID=UPI000F8D80E9|nr:glycosyltransferase family 2 protein [Pelagibacterium montanilacus]
MTLASPVSVVMPAYRARPTIARAVKSLLDQTHTAFELVVVSDDGVDYAAVLEDAGIADPRIRHVSTGAVGSGSPPARNLGLEHARHDLCAILDADDRFAPQKLALMVPAALEHGLASCALTITDATGRPLRTVGAGPDRLLGPGEYKFTNLSMDSMLVYDRRRADPRFDPALPCMTDLDFLLRLFAGIARCLHLGSPLHDYVKLPVSVSNGPGVAARMIGAKTLIRERLAAGAYRLADPDGIAGMDRFLAISLAAERSFDAAAVPQPALFEDHLEPMLSAGAA